MIYLLVGTLLLFAPGAWAVRRAQAEIDSDSHISRPTFLAAYIAFTGHSIVTAAAAFLGAWPMPAPPISFALALASGLPIFAAGAAVNIAGRRQFHSFRLMWGLDNNRLVTGGIYAWTRNPQTVGWLLMYIGMGFLGRSWAALALAAVFLLALLFWIPVEEHVLHTRFGEQYARYRQSVPRFFRLMPRQVASRVIEPKTWNAPESEHAENRGVEPVESVR